MRAAQLRKQPDAWDIPTLEDDAETQIYFNPPSPESELPALHALPPVRMSLPVAAAPVVPVLRAAPPPVPARQPRPQLQPVPQPMLQPQAMPQPQPQAMPHRMPAMSQYLAQDVMHTHRVPRHRPVPRRTMLIGVASACVLVGTLIGGAVALRGGSHAQHAAASAVPAQVVVAPAPAPAPVIVAPAPAPAPAPTVTVTPIEQPAPPPAALPADTRTTLVVAEAPALAVPVAPAPQPVQAVQAAPRHHAHQAPTHHVAAPVAVAHAAPAPAPVAHGATGTLDLSTKPPCEIVIDGKATGMMTPRRGIALTAGRHEVTLTNADQGVQLTTEVTVTAGQSIRMIRDFTK